MPGSARPCIGYFGSESELFGCLHLPKGAGRDLAVVICRPLGYEGIQTYRTLRVLSGRLADVGIPTLRFDYHGTGESAGSDDDDDRVGHWVSSVTQAARLVGEIEGIEKVALVGIRIGATLALAAAEEAVFDGVVLWEPCESGAAFLREMEIMATAGGRGQREENGSRSHERRVLEAAGYAYTAETQAGLATLDAARVRPKGRPPVLLIQRADRRSSPRLARALGGAGLDVDVRSLPGHAEMMVQPASSAVPEEILSHICAWTHELADEGKRTQAVRPASLALEATHGGLRHCAEWLGPGQDLFAAITRPVEPVRERGCVVFLSGGVVPRTAVNGLYVECARALGAHGWSSVRLDISGVGESPGRGNVENVAFPPSLVDDVHTALDTLDERGFHSPFALVGLCSGAYAAFQAARTRADVNALVLVNPWLLRERDRRALQAEGGDALGDPRGPMGLKAALDGARAGHVAPGLLLRVLLRRGGDLSAPKYARLRASVGLRPRGLGREVRELSERGVDVALAFSDGDPGIDAVLGPAGPEIERLSRQGRLRLRTFERADHTFGSRSTRAALVAWIRECLCAPALTRSAGAPNGP